MSPATSLAATPARGKPTKVPSPSGPPPHLEPCCSSSVPALRASERALCSLRADGAADGADTALTAGARSGRRVSATCQRSPPRCGHDRNEAHRSAVSDGPSVVIAEAITWIDRAAPTTADAVRGRRMAALLGPPSRPPRSGATAGGRRSRERQVVAIARFHLEGGLELVDALARDHLVDHPDSLIVSWIASGAGPRRSDAEPDDPTRSRNVRLPPCSRSRCSALSRPAATAIPLPCPGAGPPSSWCAWPSTPAPSCGPSGSSRTSGVTSAVITRPQHPAVQGRPPAPGPRRSARDRDRRRRLPARRGAGPQSMPSPSWMTPRRPSGCSTPATNEVAVDLCTSTLADVPR